VAPPALDEDLRVSERADVLAIERLIAELGVEALGIPVLPGTAWLDVSRPGAQGRDPVAARLGHKLRPVIRADVLGHASLQHELGQSLDDSGRGKLAMRELVHDAGAVRDLRPSCGRSCRKP
jgi:hypothetical protein